MFPQIFGKYVLEREMAQGGMARVFLATLRGAGGFEKRLVVKQIRPELASDERFVSRFVAEAKTAVSLSHPNIVPVYELGVEQGTYYIAMELCEGVTLADLLHTGVVLSAAEGAYLGVEICRALDYAHRRSVVHRDITPRNVMIDAEGAVRLIDFGIAGSVGGAADPANKQVFGSLGHMSPEHLAGEALGPGSDVFAVGTVLIEAWTGKAPFRRSTLEQTRAALARPPAPLSSANAELAPLDGLLLAAVGADAAQRPSSAEELARPLRDFLKANDVGDVARTLGITVAELLNDRASRPAPTLAPVTSDSGERATGQTRTFAVQPAFDEWTRPLPEAGGDGSATVGPRTEPLVASSKPGGPATRWLRWPVALALIAALAMVGLLFARPDSNSTSGRELAQERPPRAPAVAVAAPTAESATEHGPAEPPTPIVTVPQAPQTNNQIKRNTLDAVEEPTAALRGYLTLSADPACRVLVEGQERGRTPLHQLALPVGTHRVEFVSESMGERLGTSIELRAGQQRTLHADFTAATPRLSVR